MEDWAVWPIFVLQAFALFVLLLPKSKRFLGLSSRSIVMLLLIMVCIAIVASLYHDSTSTLHLYF
jgi:hypothetical protein